MSPETEGSTTTASARSHPFELAAIVWLLVIVAIYTFGWSRGGLEARPHWRRYAAAVTSFVR